MDEANGHGVFEFNAGRDDVVVEVVDALSTVRDMDPIDVEPLQTYIDPDSLAGIVDSHHRQGDGELTVNFCVDSYEILVESHGRIHVTERQGGEDAPTE